MREGGRREEGLGRSRERQRIKWSEKVKEDLEVNGLVEEDCVR